MNRQASPSGTAPAVGTGTDPFFVEEASHFPSDVADEKGDCRPRPAQWILQLHLAAVLLSSGCWLIGPAAGQSSSSGGPGRWQDAQWPMEGLDLVDGRHYEGLMESEDTAWVHWIVIERRPGRPMFLVIRPFERESVAKVVRLDPDRRAKLRQQLDQFIHRARIEAARTEAVRLSFAQRDGDSYRRYRGNWFSLDSTLDEVTTRRIIVRIEQVFTAYRQLLPPRAEAQRPLRIVVLGSMEEYHGLLRRFEVRVPSQACFLPGENLVVAGSELTRFRAMLESVNTRHQQLRGDLEALHRQMSAELARMGAEFQQQGVPGNEIAQLLRARKRKFQEEIDRKQKELDRCNRENAEKFDGVTRQMFARLYHEAFHAYLENYVYPHTAYHVPRWLNEGLAMVCETGLLEIDTLRIDAPDPTLLERLKADLAGRQPLPLERLLAADPRAFVSGSETDGLVAQTDPYFVASWGLAYYLTFERSLLGSPALAEYVRQASSAVPPVARFERLVGMPLGQFEPQWRAYFRSSGKSGVPTPVSLQNPAAGR